MISLVKNIKKHSGMSNVLFYVYWKTKENAVAAANQADVDVCVFLLTKEGRCGGDGDIIFYGNAIGKGGRVVHQGKMKRGDFMGEGFKIDMLNMPTDVEKIAITMSIYESTQDKLKLGMIESAFVSIVDCDSGSELHSFDIKCSFTNETAAILCGLDKKSGKWKLVNNVNIGYQGGLRTLCKKFAIEVDGCATPVEQSDQVQKKVFSQPEAVQQVRMAPPPPPPMPASSKPINEPLKSNSAGVRLGVSQKIGINPEPMAMPAPVMPNIAPPNGLRCSCGAELRANAKFCASCGNQVLQGAATPPPQVKPNQQFCKNCGNMLREGIKFCTKCGQPCSG